MLLLYGVVVDKLSIICMANLRVLVLIERKKRERKMKGNHFAIIIVLHITSWYLHVAFLFKEMVSAKYMLFINMNNLT